MDGERGDGVGGGLGAGVGLGVGEGMKVVARGLKGMLGWRWGGVLWGGGRPSGSCEGDGENLRCDCSSRELERR